MLNLTRAEGSLPEDFHLSRRAAVGSMFFAGYAVAALSANAEPITTDEKGLVISEVTIANGADKPLPAYVARPAGRGRHPAILVVNEVFGIHDYIKDVCKRLAKQGYVAVAPDIFYRSGVNLPATTDMKIVMATVGQASLPQVTADIAATTAWMKAQAFTNGSKMGVTGYCYGGGVVWRTAMVNPDVKAGVAFYGPLKPLFGRAAELKAPVLGFYGGKDAGIPLTDVAQWRKELGEAGNKTHSEIVVYPEAQHGFHADYRASYNAEAAQDAWKRLLAHFKANGVA